MENFLKGKLDQTQKSNSIWLVITIKILIIKRVNKLGPPVFSFQQTQEYSRQNSQLLAVFNVNLGAVIEAQNRSPLYYGLEFQYIAGIKKLFRHHEDKEIIVDIIQKGSRYHLSYIMKKQVYMA